GDQVHSTLRRHCEEQSDEAIHSSPREQMDCFASLAMTGCRSITSIRLHIFFRDDGVDAKSLVDKTLLLQPFDLVADVFHVELAVGIDIGAIADHLLD